MNPDLKFFRFPSPQGNVVFGSGEIVRDETVENVSIYGDPEGLRWLAKVLLAIADIDQRQIPDDNLPLHEGFHTHLCPGTDCHPESKEMIIGRLDAKSDSSTSWFFDWGRLRMPDAPIRADFTAIAVSQARNHASQPRQVLGAKRDRDGITIFPKPFCQPAVDKPPAHPHFPRAFDASVAQWQSS